MKPAPKPPRRTLLTRSITTKVTPEQKAQFEADAAELGLSPSDYARFLWLDKRRENQADGPNKMTVLLLEEVIRNYVVHVNLSRLLLDRLRIPTEAIQEILDGTKQQLARLAEDRIRERLGATLE